MVAIWGPENFNVAQSRADEQADQRMDAHLLNGPSMPGQGRTQDEIDALLAGAASAAPKTPPATPETASVAPAPIKVAVEPPPPPKSPPAPVPAVAAAGASASQADIDKLFD
jgi:hypothetical protein